MGGGASRAQSAPHPEPTASTSFQKIVSNLSPRSPFPQSPSRSISPKGRQIQVREKILSDSDLLNFEKLPVGKADPKNSSPVGKRSSDTTVSPKFIFSSINSPSSIHSSNHSTATNKFLTQRNSLEGNDIEKLENAVSMGDGSKRRNERHYWLEGGINAQLKKDSWKEIELAALTTKQFTGNVRTLNRRKLKNVRQIAVTPQSPL